jgi:hypothetical protein
MKNNSLFNLEQDKTKSEETTLAGLAVYFELLKSIKFYDDFKSSFKDFHPSQGWDAFSIILIIIFLNFAGYDHVSDVSLLIADTGFVLMFREYLKHEMTTLEWIQWQGRFNKCSNGTLPCSTAILDFLNTFKADGKKGVKGVATIHSPTEDLLYLEGIVQHINGIAYKKAGSPETLTLDQDATVVETQKEEALFTYLKKKGVQPVNVYCTELNTIAHTEFRDGNVPAKMGLMEMLLTTIKTLPKEVEHINYRGDSASFQYDFMKSMASGSLDPNGKVIEFGISTLATPHIKSLYNSIPEDSWKPQNESEKQEYVEIAYYQKWMGTIKPFRLLVIRSKQKHQETSEKNIVSAETMWDSNQIELPLNIDEPQKIVSIQQGDITYDMRSIISNVPATKLNSKDLIKWARKRAGKAEAINSVQKTDLSGGILPSGDFCVNWAWWLIMNIALNLHSLMQITGLPKRYKNSRFKRIRAMIIYCGARISIASRYFKIRIKKTVQLYLLMEIIKNIQHSFNSS